MAEEHLLDEIKRYVGFGPEDEALLRGLSGRMRPRFAPMAEDFYDHILNHEGAQKAITGGHAQVERLKGTLRGWMEGLVTGPWDIGYYELRARIGRKHVQINLPQQYMFTAVNVIRLHFLKAILETSVPEQARVEMGAVDKLLDMELAIMLHTYREDYLAQMQRNERLATFGQLVASIGHELRNPLGVMESSLFLMRGRVGTDDRVTRHMDKIQGQIKLANRIVSDLLDMVRDKPAQRRPVEVSEVVSSALDLLPRTGTRTSVEIAPGLARVRIDPDQVRQVLVNLLSNGMDAAGAEGEVRVLVRQEGRVVLVLVNDSGAGIDPTIRGRLFEPLVTTKARGIGLGLALCRRLVERNGGSIRLSAGPLPGAAFEVELPTEEEKK